MVSFWKYQKPPNPLEFICLGILIRSNWIFVAKSCADNLEPFGDIVIEYGVYNIHNISPKASKIVNKTSLPPRSRFSIVYVSNFTK